MEQRKSFDDLWRRFQRFEPELKEHYGLPSQCHIRYLEEQKSDGNGGKIDHRTLVYAIRRSKPKEGYEKGNFSIAEDVLDWACKMQGDGSRHNPGCVDQAYVVLVESYEGGDIVAYDTAKNVRRILNQITPYENQTSGGFYYWVNETLQPIGSYGPSIREPPF